MGALLSAPAACLGSCLGSCALGACCRACSCRCVVSPSVANLVYVALILLSSGLALGLRYGGLDLSVTPFTGPSWVPASSFSYTICSTDNCKGYFAVYRVSFTLAAFFLGMLLLTCCATRFSVRAHRGFWWAKLVFLAGLLVGTLFMPNDFFAGYAWAARFVAPLFILYQMVVFIDFGYTLNQQLVGKDEEQVDLCGGNGGFRWRGLLLGLSAVTLVGSLVAVGVFYANWGGCAYNVAAITTTLLFGVLNTAISVSRIAQHGALFTSGLVFAYTSWLCFSGLSSYPDATCNPMVTADGATPSNGAAHLVVSCIVAALSLGYMAYRLGRRQIGRNAMSGKPADGDDIVTVSIPGDATDAEAVEPESFRAYHLTMLLVSMYMAMLLTDWGVGATAASQRYNGERRRALRRALSTPRPLTDGPSAPRAQSASPARGCSSWPIGCARSSTCGRSSRRPSARTATSAREDFQPRAPLLGVGASGRVSHGECTY